MFNRGLPGFSCRQDSWSLEPGTRPLTDKVSVDAMQFFLRTTAGPLNFIKIIRIDLIKCGPYLIQITVLCLHFGTWEGKHNLIKYYQFLLNTISSYRRSSSPLITQGVLFCAFFCITVSFLRCSDQNYTLYSKYSCTIDLFV